MNFEVKWQVKSFYELTTDELYAITRLRQLVFVIEQQCLYEDLDGSDQGAQHVLGKRGNEIVAYARILPADAFSDKCRLGRVLTASSERGKGTGRMLIATALEYIHIALSCDEVKISAQAHLIDFYRSFDFNPISDVYLEDGIPHIDMIKNWS